MPAVSSTMRMKISPKTKRLAKVTARGVRSAAGSSSGVGMGEAEAELLQQIIGDLKADSRHVLPVYSFIQKRKRGLTADTADQVLGNAAVFAADTLNKLPDEFKVQWIVDHSDLTAQDLLAMLQKDNQSLNYLIQFAVQIAVRMKLPERLKFVECLKRFLHFRYELCGCRLTKIKERGGIVDHVFQMALCGSYTMMWKNGLISEVAHVSGDKVKVEADAHLAVKYNLVDNIDDFACSLVLPPLPPMRLASFFEAKKSGPWKLTNYVGKPKELQSTVDEIFTAWEAEARAAMESGETEEVIVKGLQEHKKKAHQENMDKARDMAKAALTARKAKKSVSLSELNVGE
jgi:hypothetical protein